MNAKRLAWAEMLHRHRRAQRPADGSEGVEQHQRRIDMHELARSGALVGVRRGAFVSRVSDIRLTKRPEVAFEDALHTITKNASASASENAGESNGMAQA